MESTQNVASEFFTRSSLRWRLYFHLHNCECRQWLYMFFCFLLLLWLYIVCRGHPTYLARRRDVMNADIILSSSPAASALAMRWRSFAGSSALGLIQPRFSFAGFSYIARLVPLCSIFRINVFMDWYEWTDKSCQSPYVIAFQHSISIASFLLHVSFCAAKMMLLSLWRGSNSVILLTEMLHIVPGIHWHV